VVGNIMGGLLLGILLARPLSSLVADHFGWRTVFIGAAGVMLAITVAGADPAAAPARAQGQLCRADAVAAHLLRRYPLLRQRSLYQALMFARSAFTGRRCRWPWPVSMACRRARSLVRPGRRGAVAAPIGGRLADAGHARAGRCWRCCWRRRPCCWG
jgi:predicted MFS family arabinose efflux permease